METVIAPELQKDGGDIELVDIADNKVYVKLQGRCSSCKNSILTIKSFVEATLKDKVNSNLEVIQV
ncbi:NifU family protein [bacterium]|nr:NifU family protein [bacterium]